MTLSAIDSAVDRVVSTRLGGIEKQLDEVRELLTRMVRVEERQTNYKEESEALRKDLNVLYDRLRLLETANAVQDSTSKMRLGNTERTLWASLSFVVGLAGAWIASHFK